LLRDYFPQLTSTQQAQFEQLPALYGTLNAEVNVISRKDIEHLMTRHVLHSLAIAKFIQFAPGTHNLDIGTGGGFPGIPLAILFPEVRWTLSDSIGKKIRVVQAVVDALELQNVTAIHARAESIPGTFDLAVSRAVAPLSELVKWSFPKIAKQDRNAIPNGIICLKGGDLKEELAPFRSHVEEYAISTWFSDDFFETKKVIYLPK
jgi:16S rRNA (guanine527-N7)-methyltransferase